MRGKWPRIDNAPTGRVKYWEIIAESLKKRGCSLGYVSTVDSQGRTIWIVDAHRGDGKRYVVRADEKLTAFLELESATRGNHYGSNCVSHSADQ
jgi:hypothetical protein